MTDRSSWPLVRINGDLVPCESVTLTIAGDPNRTATAFVRRAPTGCVECGSETIGRGARRCRGCDAADAFEIDPALAHFAAVDWPAIWRLVGGTFAAASTFIAWLDRVPAVRAAGYIQQAEQTRKLRAALGLSEPRRCPSSCCAYESQEGDHAD